MRPKLRVTEMWKKGRLGEQQKVLNNYTTKMIPQKTTYDLDWHLYNESQTQEKLLFVKLLSELCDLVEEPAHTKGRRPKPLRDVVYAICLRTYHNMSSRRIESDLELSKRAEYMTSSIAFNTLLDHLERPELKPLLKELIELSALPLRFVESDFAIDATGFSTVNYVRYFDYRHKADMRCKTWRKCHAVCGVKTNIITSVEITPGSVHDTTQFESLVRDTSRNFSIKEFSADKGYLSKNAYNLIDELGGIAYIPFKINSRINSHEGGRSILWKKMLRHYQEHQQEFLQKYHKRSNIESCFSMIKRKFGNGVKCRKETSQDNEILAKILCHNICVLIQEIFLNDIAVDFNYCAETYVAREKN